MKSLAYFFTYALAVVPFVLVNAVSQLTVDCNAKIRRATHCASGAHYGLIENVPKDYKNLVAPLNVNVMRAPARSGNGRQQPIGDVIKVAQRLKESPGARVTIELADILPGWPYKWPGIQTWFNEIRSFINDKKKSGLTNFYGNEIWNEPDVTWKDSNGLSFNQMWKQTYDLLRQIDPNEKIIGPSFSWYEENKMKNFLQFSKQNNCLPDIIAWHELSGIDGVSSHFRSYRNLEKSMGISERPITINEYCDENHDLEGQPGSSARFIGRFERYKVDSGMITWWFVPHPGRLGSLLASDTQKGAGWYFYKWYGDMTGDMVSVTPPNENSKLIDGAASVDASAQYVSFIFGGPNDGSVKANFKNLPSFLGSTAHVKVEKIDWKNKDTPSNGPNTIFEKNYSISNGQISVDVSGTNASSGYRIYITKADGSSNNTGNNQPAPSNPTSNVSGDRYKIINRYTNRVLAVENDSTANNANVLQWGDNGSSGQQWVVAKEGDQYRITSYTTNKALDVSGRSTADGGNVIIYDDKAQGNQRWKFIDAGDGYVIIENVNSGKVLDVDNASKEYGANIMQWRKNGSTNQQWKLVPLNPPATTTTITTTVTKSAQSTTNASASSCSAKILSQGYKCCKKGCAIIYTDDDGTWGVENGEWCGCTSSNDSSSCPSNIAAQGYQCCSPGNCSIYLEDDTGRWGIENDEWCGTPSNC
ncbi:hypothetical protein H8356DRAFT_339299 [Neocallimastix lanati (nom. inval.)]|jgi:hypothetical protein|uniref:CBM10 domain-containing protein n=1 Tax=Neocallimastix californiae TaxID=1754190 RepID=A0A1Y2ARM2_9FUNG|nr:hypothetical protein H8356DRAFT_339299 [Neocallimastix sp. JGI-2020a]ORY25229.1 hypothetical protein LY90DRAFT_706376 [Neocallimastix californiae]|eukprot:ORY25229.1 hypothetical protein LY90DRAFT_706376 [Neocallimastix californiae]